ncbi:hypothetical protein [Bacillus testis]|uniref:hypothetical protein n=1 Tax=Bacillus testis TaxID=1622072 RepID=UPI00067E9E1E|nr:hypothetical protein [Bacillus testis]
MYLKDIIPETYIPAIITSSVALTAAIIAQFLNNWLIYKREKKKYKQEIFEKFISEHLIDVLRYPSAVTRLIDDKSIDKEIDISKNLDEMFKKIHYGDKRLQSAFLSYKTFAYMDDVNPSNYKSLEKYLQYKICYYFLLYCKYIFKEINFKLEKSMENTITHATKEYALLFIYTRERDYNEAKDMLISINRFHLNSLSYIPLERLEKFSNEQILEIILKVDNELKNYLDN